MTLETMLKDIQRKIAAIEKRIDTQKTKHIDIVATLELEKSGLVVVENGLLDRIGTPKPQEAPDGE